VASLSGSESDLLNPNYVELKERMTAIREVNPDSRFVYLMGSRNGELFFYVDSEPEDSEDYSPPGQIYFEESPAISAAILAGISSVEGPTRDRWGEWITGVAPVVDETGKPIAAVGIDVDAKENKRIAIAQSSIPFLLVLILLSFVYFGGKLRRKEAAFLAIKSQFVALATHQIRSPLTGIIWSLQELEKKEVIARESIEPIAAAATELDHTVNDILYSFTLDKKAMEANRIDLIRVVEESINSLAAFAKKKSISINFKHETPMVVKGDKEKLVYVFTNIISNAIKYSPDNNAVDVVAKAEHGHALIEVTDHGIGIPLKDQAKVFNGFYRASNVKEVTASGTGLGLYTAKMIIDAHAGSVKIHSKEGEGTTVSVELTLA
jgi:signal transduction histidine kinase